MATPITKIHLEYWAKQVEEMRLAAKLAKDSRAWDSDFLYNTYAFALHRYRVALREYREKEE